MFLWRPAREVARYVSHDRHTLEVTLLQSRIETRPRDPRYTIIYVFLSLNVPSDGGYISQLKRPCPKNFKSDTGGF